MFEIPARAKIQYSVIGVRVVEYCHISEYELLIGGWLRDVKCNNSSLKIVSSYMKMEKSVFPRRYDSLLTREKIK